MRFLDLTAGTVFEGRYRIEGVLGEGGMGRVYRARHLELGERVALKVLRQDRALGREAHERLRREARTAARIRGENVARVIDAGVSEEHGPFLVLEHVAGKSLAAVLAEEGPLEEKRAIGCVLQVALALAEAHGLGIVHRDLKPSNLLLTVRPDGSELVKVTDFGIAKAEALAGTLTGTQNLLGSPKYMSPEQIREARSVDARSDVWSLGIVLYELVTGHLPFEAFTATGVLSRIVTDAPTPMEEVFAGVTKGLEAVVFQMLEKRPEDRPASMAAVASALVPFGDDHAAALADRVARVERTPRAWSDAPDAEPPLVEALPAGRASSDETVTASSRTHDEVLQAPPAPPSPSSPLRSALPWLGGAAVVALLVGGTVAFGRGAPDPEKSAAVAPAASASAIATASSPALPAPSSSTLQMASLAVAIAPPPPVSSGPSTSPRVRPSATSATHAPSAPPVPSDELDFGPRK